MPTSRWQRAVHRCPSGQVDMYAVTARRSTVWRREVAQLLSVVRRARKARVRAEHKLESARTRGAAENRRPDREDLEAALGVVPDVRTDVVRSKGGAVVGGVAARRVEPKLEAPPCGVFALGEGDVPHLIRVLDVDGQIGAEGVTNERCHPTHKVVRRKVVHTKPRVRPDLIGK